MPRNTDTSDNNTMQRTGVTTPEGRRIALVGVIYTISIAVSVTMIHIMASPIVTAIVATTYALLTVAIVVKNGKSQRRIRAGVVVLTLTPLALAGVAIGAIELTG